LSRTTEAAFSNIWSRSIGTGIDYLFMFKYKPSLTVSRSQIHMDSKLPVPVISFGLQILRLSDSSKHLFCLHTVRYPVPEFVVRVV
jgi:hypothetical protein